MRQAFCSSKIPEYYAAGWDLLTERLFNYENLSHGIFKKFICKKSFTYDSDIFNSALSYFARDYNLNGRFCISGDIIGKNNLLMENRFDPYYLNGEVENYNEALKYVPTFICDTNCMWCIFLHNDLDAFITWIHPNLKVSFEKAFLKETNEYYAESNDIIFLSIIVDRFGYLNDFKENALLNSIITNNAELFQIEEK